MPNKPHQFFAILEAPLAHIQPLYASAYKLLRVERRVPGLDEQRAEDDFEDVGPGRGFLRWLQGRRGGRRGHGGYIGGHWAGTVTTRRGAAGTCVWGREELGPGCRIGLARREGTWVMEICRSHLGRTYPFAIASTILNSGPAQPSAATILLDLFITTVMMCKIIFGFLPRLFSAR